MYSPVGLEAAESAVGSARGPAEASRAAASEPGTADLLSAAAPAATAQPQPAAAADVLLPLGL